MNKPGKGGPRVNPGTNRYPGKLQEPMSPAAQKRAGLIANRNQSIHPKKSQQEAP